MTSVAGNNNVAPSTEWRAILGSAVAEVFSMMVGPAVSSADDSQPLPSANVTGTVGIAGAMSAILSLRCSDHVATRIAAQMLGVPVEDAVSHKCDAIGEICNIVAGQFKAKIGLEDKCMLSVPTVITGGDYRLHPMAGSERLELVLCYETEPICIALEIRK